MSSNPGSFPLAENVSARLLSALQFAFGADVQHVQMSVHSRPMTQAVPEVRNSCAPPEIAEVPGNDHVVRLHPQRFIPRPESQHAAHVAHVDIDSLVLAYDAATLAVRMLARDWSHLKSPVSLRCPTASSSPVRVSNAQLDHAAPYVEALLSLPLTKRSEVARTLFVVLTRPGTRNKQAEILHISPSTVRDHLDSYSSNLPEPLDRRANPSLTHLLPTLVTLWLCELNEQSSRRRA